MKTIVVSGASGYIGREFISKFYNRFNLILLGRNISTLESLGYSEHSKIIEYNNFFSMEEKLPKDSVLLNLAFPRSSNSKDVTEALKFTGRLYKKSVELGLNKIINISSQSIYNQNRLKPAIEENLPSPSDLYGIAKFYSEKYLEDFSKQKSIQFLNIRLGSVIGPGFEQRFINKIIKKLINNEGVEIYENGYNYSYIFIDDLVKNLELIIDSEIPWNTVYNLGSNQKYTITSIMKILEDLSLQDSSSSIRYNELNFNNSCTNSISNEKLMNNLENYFDTPIYDAIKKIYLCEFEKIRGRK